MLHLIGRQKQSRAGVDDGPPDHVLRSHIFPRFLRRLRAIDHPYLLDLGPLSGANIEFFARLGCRVQVEDVVATLESAGPGGGPPAESPREAAPAPRPEAGPAGGRPPAAGSQSARDVRPPAATAVAPRAARGDGPRPRRHIVLPPRTFPRPGAAAPGAAAALAAGPRAVRTGVDPGRPILPTVFDHPDETFDAVVAWDVFNYYDAVSARQVAAEARRILKPGGLILTLFHARTASGPERPHRYRILEETRIACREVACDPLARHLFQNRDIEKMFTGLKIIELYFLKSAVREILMQKKPVAPDAPAPPVPPSAPKPRFTLE